MATYAIGDVHGCTESLHALLAELPLRPDEDRLWMAGDLVNRGPDSLGALRWARRMEARMGRRFVAVLGNHDVHLLARAAGVAAARRGDTLDAVLAAPDRDELVAWLRERPLLHREGDRLLVHGGLLPGWSPELAETLARDTEAVLRSSDGDRLLEDYTGRSGRFDDECMTSDPLGRAACALPVFTLLRTLRADGRPRCGFAGAPDEAPDGDRPWFEVWRDSQRPGPRPLIVFGHWATLGLHRSPGLVGLDTGCVWGGRLTAVRIDDGETFEIEALDRRAVRQAT